MSAFGGIAALAAFLVTLAGGAHAESVEDVTFPTNAIPGSPNPRPIPIQSKLYLPTKSKSPLSAVVITPSSGGVRPEREVHYARELARAGIAAIVVDSFTSRGVKNSVRDQSLINAWQSGNDAVAVLRWLIADGRFKRDRIGVTGVSKGGKVALQTAMIVRRRWMRTTDVAFAAHVPIAPGCGWIDRSLQTTGAPIFFMLGELDDQNPAAACVTHAARLRKAGNSNVEVKVYKGAHHAWEKLGAKPYFDPKAQNFSRCHIWTESNGSETAADGRRIPRRGGLAWAKKNCMTLGAHCCGSTPALKREATADLIAFLRKHGF